MVVVLAKAVQNLTVFNKHMKNVLPPAKPVFISPTINKHMKNVLPPAKPVFISPTIPIIIQSRSIRSGSSVKWICVSAKLPTRTVHFKLVIVKPRTRANFRTAALCASCPNLVCCEKPETIKKANEYTDIKDHLPKVKSLESLAQHNHDFLKQFIDHQFYSTVSSLQVKPSNQKGPNVNVLSKNETRFEPEPVSSCNQLMPKSPGINNSSAEAMKTSISICGCGPYCCGKPCCDCGSCGCKRPYCSFCGSPYCRKPRDCRCSGGCRLNPCKCGRCGWPWGSGCCSKPCGNGCNKGPCCYNRCGATPCRRGCGCHPCAYYMRYCGKMRYGCGCGCCNPCGCKCCNPCGSSCCAKPCGCGGCGKPCSCGSCGKRCGCGCWGKPCEQSNYFRIPRAGKCCGGSPCDSEFYGKPCKCGQFGKPVSYVKCNQPMPRSRCLPTCGLGFYKPPGSAATTSNNCIHPCCFNCCKKPSCGCGFCGRKYVFDCKSCGADGCRCGKCCYGCAPCPYGCGCGRKSWGPCKSQSMHPCCCNRWAFKVFLPNASGRSR